MEKGEEDEEDKLIDLKRHQNHQFISPKFIIRFILIVGAGTYLMFQVMEMIESKQNTPSTNEENSILKDSTVIEIDME